MTLREIGSESMTSRAITVVRVACCTSTCGAVPETLIVSSSEPTFISALTVAVKFDGRSTPSRTTVPKPVSENASLYTPGRIASKRYRPWLSVTVVFEPSIIAGLVTSTLTPGSTPPESSVSKPTIAL